MWHRVAVLTYRWLSFPELTVHELYQVLALRSAVFVVEQTCVYQDVDGLDPHAMHLLATRSDAVLGYLRAFAPDTSGDAVVGRVIVAASIRGEGCGTQLMEAGLAYVQATWGPCGVRLSAQAHLAGFYGALGYQITGPGYDEDGIPHLPMRRGP